MPRNRAPPRALRAGLEEDEKKNEADGTARKKNQKILQIKSGRRTSTKKIQHFLTAEFTRLSERR
jgi:hypothetical protein